MAKLRLDAAKKNQSKPNVKVGVYTNRKLLGLEGKKKKGSKKGKKGRLGHRNKKKLN